MKIFRGSTSNVRRKRREIRATADYIATIKYRSEFIINGQTVRLESYQPISVVDGERLIVAGRMNRGVLNGYAYFNETQQTIYHEDWLMGVMTSILITFATIGMQYFVEPSDLMRWIVGAIACSFCIYFLVRGYCISRAAMLIRTHLPDLTGQG